MNGDFLDNLTGRLEAPGLQSLQPRLASRFEEPVPSHETVRAEEPVVEQSVEYQSPGASGLPEPRRSNDIAPPGQEAESQPRHLHSLPLQQTPPHLSATAPAVNSAPADEPANRRDTLDLAGHLDAVTRELDRLAGRIGPPPAPPPVPGPSKRAQAAQGSAPNSAMLQVVERTTIQRFDAPARSADQAVAVDAVREVEQPAGPPPTVSVGPRPRIPVESIRPFSSAGEIEHMAPAPAPANDDEELPQARAEHSASRQTAVRETPSIPQIVVEPASPRAAVERTVNVIIDRIEIRAAPPKSAVSQLRRPTSTGSITSLDDYLRRREGGSR